MPHQAYIEVTQAQIELAFAELIGPLIPQGTAKIVTIRMNQVNDNLVLILEHESFPESEGIQRVPWMKLPKA